MRSGSREAEAYDDGIFRENRGYLVSNENIPEERSKSTLFRRGAFNRTETSRQRKKRAPITKISYGQKKSREISKPSQQESSYIRTLEDALLQERERSLRQTKEIETLRSKLERALRQLSLATQKIMDLKQERPASSKRISQTYQVKAGDSLWSIAAMKEIYGNPKKWLLLYHANRDQIYDPNLIFPNMVLLIPRLND